MAGSCRTRSALPGQVAEAAEGQRCLRLPPARVIALVARNRLIPGVPRPVVLHGEVGAAPDVAGRIDVDRRLARAAGFAHLAAQIARDLRDVPVRVAEP